LGQAEQASAGGGIYNSAGTVTLTNSTVSDNRAVRGGGIHNDAGTVTLINSTVSGNTATEDGGGVYELGPTTATTHLNNVTITGNTADADGDNSGDGGGIFNAGVLHVKNTIMVGNNDLSPAGTVHPDCSSTGLGAFPTRQYNLVGDNSGCPGFVNGANGNRVGATVTSVLDTTLADNGGGTLTRALLPASPAIDAGDPAGCTAQDRVPLTTDQRGVPRSQGTACDIGAYEAAPPVVDLNGPDGAGTDFSATFHEGGGPVAVVDTGLTVADADSASLSSATVTIVNRLDGSSEVLAVETSGTRISAVYDASAGVLVLSGTDTVANYQQVLRSVTYNNNAARVNTTPRTIAIVVKDGIFDSPTATANVAVVDPFTVTNTDDSGPGSLRQTLLNANASSGIDTISFNIPGANPHTIQPASALPTITDPVIIDGTTQPGFADTPIIELDGSHTGAGANGLHISAGNSTVQGLIINRFPRHGLLLDTGGGNTIQGNYIGTGVTGKTGLANGGDGIHILNSANNGIGGPTARAGNLISANAGDGVDINGNASAGNRLQGNLIGTTISRSVSLGNAGHGVHLHGGARNNRIGGSGNIIAHNGGDGVRVDGASTTGNTIGGNAILENSGQGIRNINGGNAELAPPVVVGAAGHMIAGTAPPASTVEIFGNDADGDEGQLFLGRTSTNGLGHFQFNGSLFGVNMTATATDEVGNTSGFSGPVTRVTDITDTFEINDVWFLAYPISVPSVAGLQSVAGPAGIGRPANRSGSSATFVSYISRPGDIDFYRLPAPERGFIITITLSGLAADFDLVLFGPGDVPSDTPLKDIPLKDIPLKDIPLKDIPLKDVPLKDIPLKDIPLKDIPLKDIPLKDISFQRGAGDEQVSAIALYATDFYYVEVVGFNGAFSSEPYTLTVEIAPPAPIPPCRRAFPFAGTAGTLYQNPAFGNRDIQTLIVTNKRRLEQLYGSAAADQMMARLQALANHATVKGIILPVETDPTVAAAYDNWDQNVCDPEAANEVAGAIKRLINTFVPPTFGLTADGICPPFSTLAEDETPIAANRALAQFSPSFPNLTYVVIVGNDEVVPFRRVPDLVLTSNERDYRNLARVQEDSALFASLDRGYVLTDDFYVDSEPTDFAGHRLYVANLPIGRLVETPDEIVRQLDHYLASGGVLPATTSLTMGYDFLKDSSQIIANTFTAKGLANDALINDNWTRQDLANSFLGTRHDINSVNAHFQHWRLEPADRTDGLFESHEIDQSPVDWAGTVNFSMGCHAGLNVCDRISTDAVAGQDFPQVFAGKQAVYVANTGYGYGDTLAPTLSEELMSDFARHLGQDATRTVGLALLQAKQEYALNNMGFYGPYDPKVLIEATLYGLPMYRVLVPSPTSGLGVHDPSAPQAVSESLRFTQSGLIVRSYTITPTLTAVSTPEGTYYTSDAGAQAMLYRSLQPRSSLDIALPAGVRAGAVAHGALFLGGSYTDIPNFDPTITLPVTETTRYEPQWIYTGWHPQELSRINHFRTPQGVLERLVLILGQFRHADVVGTHVEGIERLYNQVSYEVYYSAACDITPPTIESVSAIWPSRPAARRTGEAAGPQQNRSARFIVKVNDLSGVDRVVIVYTDGTGTWQPLGLTYDPEADEWTGELTELTGDVLFLAQAVDGAGNVAANQAKGFYFTSIPIDAGANQVADEGDEIIFGGSGPADVRTAWDFGDGLGALGTFVPTHRYWDSGRFDVTLRVSDEKGGVGLDTLSVIVNNVPPAVSIDQVTSPNPGVILPGQVINVGASFTTPGLLDTHTATIDWGDGTADAGTIAQQAGASTVSGSHRYAEAGSYAVTVRVIDDDGGEGSATTTISIQSPAPTATPTIVPAPVPVPATTAGGLLSLIIGLGWVLFGQRQASLAGKSTSLKD
jgi:hypothetical protein